MTTLGSVLIVEDDVALRQGLRSTLEAAGFCSGEASSGEEAAFALHQHQFETVLLDVNMPGIGGMEACRRIRRMYPLLPILMLTVRDEEKDKIEALDAGADDYITKPFQFLELTARLRSAISVASGQGRTLRTELSPWEILLLIHLRVVSPKEGKKSACRQRNSRCYIRSCGTRAVRCHTIGC